METKTQPVSLSAVAEHYQRLAAQVTQRVIICAGTGCVANGSLRVHEAFVRLAGEHGLNVVVELKEENAEGGTHLSHSGCQGFCQMGPLVTLQPAGILYTKVKPEDVEDIVTKTLKSGEVIERLLYVDRNTGAHCKGVADIPFYQKQHRVVLKNCGRIDPESIEEYIALDGYQSAHKACVQMTSEEVCKLVLNSGLRGRGGAGFPTGKK